MPVELEEDKLDRVRGHPAVPAILVEHVQGDSITLVVAVGALLHASVRFRAVLIVPASPVMSRVHGLHGIDIGSAFQEHLRPRAFPDQGIVIRLGAVEDPFLEPLLQRVDREQHRHGHDVGYGPPHPVWTVERGAHQLGVLGDKGHHRERPVLFEPRREVGSANAVRRRRADNE
eukprot:scaffold3068_cov269-Pinguiococcus_pyrenoidosus.AAC.12